MVDRRSLAIGAFAVLVALVAMSSVTTWGQATPSPGAPAAGAQGRGGPGGPGRGGFGGRGPAFTPTAGAKDLKTVLYNWTWHMGMLRSGNESELVKTLEYQADSGTIQVNGQPCAVKTYRISANYQVPGYRTQIECTRPNGQVYKNVETMSGEYAWDEDIAGAELVPGPRPGGTV